MTVQRLNEAGVSNSKNYTESMHTLCNLIMCPADDCWNSWAKRWLHMSTFLLGLKK